MAKLGAITINGGIFLTKKDRGKEKVNYDHWDIGYFECEAGFPDARIYIDGNEVPMDPAIKLGAKGGLIDIRLERLGQGLDTGTKVGNTFYNHLLQREKLYGAQVPLDEAKLDSVLRFHSGLFRPSMVKRRYFKQHDPSNPLSNPKRQDMGAIAHNVIVYYELQDGDKLTIADGANTYFEKVIGRDVQGRFDIEILGDDSTSLKYFCDCVQLRPVYWVPNQGMPPPTIMP